MLCGSMLARVVSSIIRHLRGKRRNTKKTQATNSVIQLNEFDKQNKIASGSFEGGICTMQNAVSVVSNGSFKVEFD